VKKQIILLSITTCLIISGCNIQITDTKPITDDSASTSRETNTEYISENEINNISWIVAPELEYDSIYRCHYCDLFGFEHDGDILDPKTGLVTKDKNIIGNGWGGHGIGHSELLYDKAKELYVMYSTDVGDEYLTICPANEFAETLPFSYYTESMIALRKIDSAKIKEIESEWGFIEYDLSKAYIGEKYALAFGSTFITDFIYEGLASNIEEAFAVKLNGKWGIVGKFGNTISPFVFDDILFIDKATAFAKYNGKYGIIEIE